MAEQELDHARESSIDAEEKEGEQKRHDDHHDARRDRFLAGRPVDLRGLGADLTDEFAGGSLGHVPSSPHEWAVAGVNPVTSILAMRGRPAFGVSHIAHSATARFAMLGASALDRKAPREAKTAGGAGGDLASPR